MSKRTFILDHPYYRVCLAGTEESERLTQYLRRLNKLLGRAKESLTPHDSTDALMTYREYQKAFANKFGFRSFTRNKAFVTVGDYLARFYPLTDPFVVLTHCVDFHPYETFCYLQDMTNVSTHDLPGINAALDQKAPFGWWSETFGQRYYLYGLSLWELDDAELGANEDEVRLLLLEAIDREKRESKKRIQQFDHLRQKHDRHDVRLAGNEGNAVAPTSRYITEHVSREVWQRDGGKCIKCGSQQELAFDHIISVARGGSCKAKNIQLLCDRCGRKKAATV